MQPVLYACPAYRLQIANKYFTFHTDYGCIVVPITVQFTPDANNSTQPAGTHTRLTDERSEGVGGEVLRAGSCGFFNLME